MCTRRGVTPTTIKSPSKAGCLEDLMYYLKHLHAQVLYMRSLGEEVQYVINKDGSEVYVIVSNTDE
jgi:hypothetical protein